MRTFRFSLAAVLIAALRDGGGSRPVRRGPVDAPIAARVADELPGLSKPVSITFDADGIPRIRAGRRRRRRGSARLRPCARPPRADGPHAPRGGGRVVRTGRPPRAGARRIRPRARHPGRPRRKAVAALPPATRALLEAYARGVNAFIARHGRFSAPEYLLLGTPRPWTPVDSMLWAETMGLYLSGNLRTELERLTLSARLDHATISWGSGRSRRAAAPTRPRWQPRPARPARPPRASPPPPRASRPRALRPWLPRPQLPRPQLPRPWPPRPSPPRPWPPRPRPPRPRRSLRWPPRPSRPCRAFRRPSPCPPPPRTAGRWMPTTAPPERRCSPATRISPTRCPASGISPASTRPTPRLRVPPPPARRSW